MEDVLEVYSRPRDPLYPVVCLDEASKQQTLEVRSPIVDSSGRRLEDSEYKRNGVSNIFMMVAPLVGWREVKITDRRTKQDWAYCILNLVDIHFADAEKIFLVQDNLNTHFAGSLYETFPPEEARRLVEKLEFHYSPKHGSWLNIAECELSAYQRQCLACRIPDQQTLITETAAWVGQRNQQQATVNWKFTGQDARIKLRRLYPKF